MNISEKVLSKTPNLLGYSAMALGFLGASESVDAQVLFFDYDPDLLITPEIDTVITTPFSSSGIRESDFELDLLQDGVVDASLYIHDRWFGGSSFGGTTSRMILQPLNSHLEVAKIYTYVGDKWMADLFSDGETIGPSLVWQSGDARLKSAWSSSGTFSREYGIWGNGALGLRYEINPGNYIYGWLKLKADGFAFGAVLEEFMWNTMPNTPITVGATAPAGSCDAPTGLTAIPLSPSTVQLSWTPGPDYFKSQIAGRKVGDPFSYVVDFATSRTIASLTPGATYEWQVRSVCSSGLASAMSSIQTFSMPPMIGPTESRESDAVMDEHVKVFGHNGKLYIQSPDQPVTSYTLYSSTGALLRREMVHANSIEATIEYPPGIYVVQLNVGGELIWRKLIH